MDLKHIIYSNLKQNTNLLNFILFFIVRTVVESIDQLINAVKRLIQHFEMREAMG